MHIASHNVEYLVDIATSYHATSHSEFSTTYKIRDFGTLKIENTSFAKIVGVGNVKSKANTSCTMGLKDVQHVSNLRLNLIFGRALDRQSYDSYFGNDS